MRHREIKTWALLLALLLPGLLAVACRATEPPPFVQVLVLRGSSYEQGVQQGQHFSSEIRSLYTRLLTNSLMPAISRERPDIAEILITYQDERYLDGRFAEEVLLESAFQLEQSIPRRYLDEMQGVADGAGLPYDEILLLNTFIDSVLGVRSIQKFINLSQAPRVMRIEVVGGLEGDGVDNDGDGSTDEAGEGRLDPYDPSTTAHLVEIPLDARIRWVITDPDGVDPQSFRLQVDEVAYGPSDPALAIKVIGTEQESLEVIFTPPAPLPAAARVTLRVEAADRTLVIDPPPTRSRVMREQAVVFGTVGLGLAPHAIPNRSILDDRFPPASMAFAVRDAATPDGAIRVGHHFVLFDGDVAHKHDAVLVHVPPDGEGFPYVTLGWTGVVWGVAGMNSEGLVWVADGADTLDNPMVKNIYQNLIAGQLISDGVPVGFQGRELLRTESRVGPAETYLESSPPTVGWMHLLADREHTLRIVERDANLLGEADAGVYACDPATLDAYGERVASRSDDDLRMTAHYAMNQEDLRLSLFGLDLLPARYWSGLWHTSVRSRDTLGDLLEQGHGSFDADKMIETLRTPELVNRRDSMTSAVFEPDTLTFRVGMGTVPATDAEFMTLDLAALVREGSSP